MKMAFKDWGKFVQLITLALSLFGTMVFFQNCTPGFQAPRNVDLSSYNNPSGVSDSAKPAEYFTCNPNDASVTSILRLTRKQYENTLTAIFGSAAVTAIKPAIENLRDDVVTKDISEFQNMVSLDHMTAYMDVAKKMALYYKSDVSRAAQLASDCIRTWPASSSCRSNFVASLGLKLFRRPLTSSEQNKIETQVYNAGDSGASAVANVIYYMMISADFLMHLEVGDPSQQNVAPNFDVVQLTDYEVASRLSYKLWDAPPDQILLDAAKNNQLQTVGQVEAQVERMLLDPRAKAKLKDFYRYWLQPRSFSESNYNTQFLSGITNLTQLNADLQTEMYEYLDYITWTKRGTYKDLLTSSVSFARTPASANLYGHAPAPAGSWATLGPERKGILMRAPVINNATTEANTIYRGVKVLIRFMCDSPGPPSGVSLNDPSLQTDEARLNYTHRERVHRLTSVGSCVGCHTSINPYGYLLENFDSIGRFKTQEEAYSSISGALLTTHNIDSRVDRVVVGNAATASLNDGTELADTIVRYNKAPACFVRQVYRYYQQKREDLTLDGCALSDALVAAKGREGDYQNASILDTLKKTIANQALFVRRIQ